MHLMRPCQSANASSSFISRAPHSLHLIPGSTVLKSMKTYYPTQSETERNKTDQRHHYSFIRLAKIQLDMKNGLTWWWQQWSPCQSLQGAICHVSATKLAIYTYTSFFKRNIYFICVCVHTCACTHVTQVWVCTKTRKGWIPWAGIIGSDESYNTHTGYQTLEQCS